MKGLPFLGFTEEERDSVKIVVSDVDDTITSNGKLYPAALNELWRLKISGKKVVLVTGGSAGWADLYIRQWPVDAVITETGALLFYKDKKGNVETKVSSLIDRENVGRKRVNLFKMTEGLTFSSDQFARLYDIAYEKSKLDKDEISILKKTLALVGANFRESSIHINAWFGNYNKGTAIKEFLCPLFNMNEEEIINQSLYLGDSLNDQELFALFKLSVGMQSVEKNRNDFIDLPTYIAKGYGGFGFTEVITSLLPSE